MHMERKHFIQLTDLTLSKIRNLTQSPSDSAAGTSTFISLDLAVVMDVLKDSLLRYNWQPDVLSTDIVGAEP